jgi:hypothetical protein
MEFGKDVIAVDPKGRLHAYQLKDAGGAKVTKEWWRKEIEPQWSELCDAAVVHGAVKTGSSHKPWIVVNAELNEEVHHLLAAKNQLRPASRRVGLIVRGQLVKRVKDLGSSFWPDTDSTDYSHLLEIFLSAGTELFPKEKLALLLEAISCGRRRGSKPDARRLITSISVLTAVVLERFQRKENHYAEFEAWIVCLSSALQISERMKLRKREYQPQISLIIEAALGALERLCDEVMKNPGCSQGSPFSDCRIRDTRMTLIAGALSTYALWRHWRHERPSERDEFVKTFTRNCISNLKIPGECAAPSILALALYRGTVSGCLDKEAVLLNYLNAVIHTSLDKKSQGLPSPYQDYDTSLLTRMGIDDKLFKESFVGISHSAKSFFDLLVRTNLKQRCRALWPDYSRLNQEEFIPQSPVERYRWRNDKGVTETRMVPPRQNWKPLVAAAKECFANGWPRLLRQDPGMVLAFCLVYPHRLNAEIARWLDSKSLVGRPC